MSKKSKAATVAVEDSHEFTARLPYVDPLAFAKSLGGKPGKDNTFKVGKCTYSYHADWKRDRAWFRYRDENDQIPHLGYGTSSRGGYEVKKGVDIRPLDIVLRVLGLEGNEEVVKPGGFRLTTPRSRKLWEECPKALAELVDAANPNQLPQVYSRLDRENMLLPVGTSIEVVRALGGGIDTTDTEQAAAKEPKTVGDRKVATTRRARA